MKKVFILLVSLLVIGIVAIGCAPSSAPAPTTTAGPVQQPTQPTKPIELSLNLTFPQQTPAGAVYQKWADDVNKNTGGKVKINIFWSASLLKINEMFRGVQQGAADMSIYIVGIDPGLMPLNEFVRLPFLGWLDWMKAHTIYNNVVKKYPALTSEWQGLKAYGTIMMTPYQIHTIKTPVTLPDDTKGLKLLAQSELVDVLKLAGASPIDQPVTEWFMSLERGVAQGAATNFANMAVFGLGDLLKTHTVIGENGISLNPETVVINPDSWKKLPADVQKVFTDLEPEFIQARIAAHAATAGFAIKSAQDAKHTIITLTPEQIAVWAKLGKPIQEQWVKAMAAKGHPAQAILDDTLKLIQGK